MPVQTNTPLPSSTLQSHFHPHFPFFSFLLPPGAAFRPSHYLISVSPVGSGGLHSFILFAPSAEKNPLFPCCSVQRLLLPPSSKNGERRAGATTCDVEKNKNLGGGFLFCKGFAQKAPWRGRPQSVAGAGCRDEGGKWSIRASPGQGKAAGSSPGCYSGFKEPVSSLPLLFC